MKKIVLSLLVLAATVNVFAAESRAKLTLANANETNSAVIILTDDANAASRCMPLYEGGLGAALVTPYFSVNGANYRIYVTNDADEEISVAFKTNEDVSYTLSVSEVTGTINFRSPDGNVVVLADGQSWTLTKAEVDALNLFVNPSNVQTAFVCQVAGGLSFHGDIAYSGLVIYDENDNEVVAAFDLAVGEDKVVAIAAAGRYYIKNGDQKIFFVVR